MGCSIFRLKINCSFPPIFSGLLSFQVGEYRDHIQNLIGMVAYEGKGGNEFRLTQVNSQCLKDCTQCHTSPDVALQIHKGKKIN